MSVLLSDVERARTVAALHILLSRIHLHEAGARRLTAEEEYTLYLVDQWYSKRESDGFQQTEIPVAGRKPTLGFICRCKEDGCPHEHLSVTQ